MRSFVYPLCTKYAASDGADDAAAARDDVYELLRGVVRSSHYHLIEFALNLPHDSRLLAGHGVPAPKIRTNVIVLISYCFLSSYMVEYS